MENPLELVYLRLTEAGTERQIRLKASLVGGVQENSRGTTDVYTELTQDGDSKVFIVTDTPDEIFVSMREAYQNEKREQAL